MHWTTLLAFIALDTVLCFIPGPAVMATVGAALRRRQTGFATATGILTGNAAYFVLSALGVASVITASHAAFLALKWAGVAFLAYLGLRSLIAKEPESTFIAPDRGDVARGWASGTTTQLANPKAFVFFAAIIPQFVDPHANVAAQILTLGVASTLIELGVLSTYVVTADAVRRRGITPRSRMLAERVGGAMLLGVAAAIARESL